MRAWRHAVVVACASAVAGASERNAFASDEAPGDAKPVAETGFRASVRAGYGVAYGEAAKGSNINRNTAAAIPIWVDFGYRLNRFFYVGMYASYGPVFSDACPDDASCSGDVVRAGAVGHVRFMPSSSWRPWVGLGFGLEQFRHGAKGAGAESRVGYVGLELVQLHSGIDFAIARGTWIGPFASASVGSYMRMTATSTVSGQTDTSSGELPAKSIHGWATFGLRVTFDL